MTPSQPPLRVAIIGAGPSGCYLAQSLTRTLPNTDITLFDRNISPYGLIRSGVAADHQHTKHITRQFERLFAQPNVRFAGNLTIGNTDTEPGADLSLAEIHHSYDAVVHATGLFHDRTPDITGSTLPGVYGAGSLIRTLNTAPHAPELLPTLGQDIVIIGFGNVALDLLRFLVKAHDDHHNSDIADTALDGYLAQPAQRITVLIRGAATELKADAAMLTELAKLPRASYRVDAPLPTVTDQLDRDRASRLTALHTIVDPARITAGGPHVTLHFETTPQRITGAAHVTGVEAATPSSTINIPASSVITAIGFTAEDTALTPPEDAAASYLTGWVRRGPTGAIPENRKCAKEIADRVTADFAAGTLESHPEKHGFAGLPTSAQQKSVSFEQWQRLDAHEIAQARPHRVRRKSADHAEMLRIATAPATPGAPSALTEAVSTPTGSLEVPTDAAMRPQTSAKLRIRKDQQ